jgi:hypothetical protein
MSHLSGIVPGIKVPYKSLYNLFTKPLPNGYPYLYINGRGAFLSFGAPPIHGMRIQK